MHRRHLAKTFAPSARCAPGREDARIPHGVGPWHAQPLHRPLDPPTARLGFAAMAAFALALGWTGDARAASDAVDPAIVIAGDESTGPVSVSGNYLAARHAERADDWGSAAIFMSAALQQSPGDELLLRTAYRVMLGAGRFDDAVAALEQVEEIGRTDPIAALTQVVNDLRSGRTPAADDRLRRMPRDRLSQFAGPLVHAWVVMKLNGSLTDAIAVLSPLQRVNGLQALYNLHVALLSEHAGDLSGADAAYARALEGGAPLRIMQAAAAFRQRADDRLPADSATVRWFDANPVDRLSTEGAFPEVRAAEDGAAEALFNLSAALDQDATDNVALLVGRLALALRPDFGFARLVLGDQLMRNERYGDALIEYGRAAELADISWDARLRMAGALDGLERGDEAISLLREMAAEAPERPEPLMRIGDIQRQAERFAEAIEPYTQALQRIPNPTERHWAAFYARGIALERAKRWPEAEADFLKALELSPDQPYVLNYLGYTWIDRGVNLDRGKGMVERAVALRPNDGSIVDSLGWAYFRLGELSQAVRYLERAVELEPLNSTINDHLGDAYWAVGRYVEAKFQWNRALLSSEEPEEIAAIREKLARDIPDRRTAGVTPPGAPTAR